MTDHKEMNVSRHAVYFGTDDQPMLGWLHLPPTGIVSSKVIILCQPLALDYMSAYRSMRYLADYFASAGFLCMRFDYYGTGDSGGFTEQDKTIEFAEYSVEEAIKWLGLSYGFKSFSLVGFRFGASIAAKVSEHTKLEQLVLWSPIDNGKRYLREIKALQATSQVSSSFHQLEAAGMVYWDNTQKQLADIDFTNLKPLAKKIVVIPRDDSKRIPKFYEHWQQEKLSVELLPLSGSVDMLKLAEDTRVPHNSFDTLVNHLNVDDTNKLDLNKLIDNKSKLSSQIKVNYKQYTDEQLKDVSDITEKMVVSDQSGVFGILTERDNKDLRRPCIILLNSGAIHRVGSNRLHVLLARQLADKGFSSLRMDIPGLGDTITNNPELENKEHLPSIQVYIYEMIEQLKSKGYHSFILAGLSSGAFYAYNAMLHNKDDSIIDSLIINPEQFYVNQNENNNANLAAQERGWLYYIEQLKSPKKWKKLISGNVNFKYIGSIVLGKSRAITKKITNKFKSVETTSASSIKNKLDHDLQYLANNNRQVTFVLSEQDPANEIIKLLGGSSLSRLEKAGYIKRIRISGADHTFSKYKPMTRMISMVTDYICNTYSNGEY